MVITRVPCEWSLPECLVNGYYQSALLMVITRVPSEWSLVNSGISMYITVGKFRDGYP